MIHITCRLTAKYRDQLWNPTLANRVWASFFVCAGSLAKHFIISSSLPDCYIDGNVTGQQNDVGRWRLLDEIRFTCHWTLVHLDVVAFQQQPVGRQQVTCISILVIVRYLQQRSARERGWRETRGFRGKSAGMGTDAACIPHGWKY